MAWIETIPPEEAGGPLKKEYDEAVARSGSVANVVSLVCAQSLTSDRPP